MIKSTLAIAALVMSLNGCKTDDGNTEASDVLGVKVETTAGDYDSILSKAKVLEDVNVASYDIIAGNPEVPPELRSVVKGGKLVKPRVVCTFVEPDKPTQGGKSPKFECRAETPIDGETGKKVKVKYDPAEFDERATPNGEVFAEAATTRFFAAMGFRTDNIMPVTLVCKNCPDEPFTYITEPDKRARVTRHPERIMERAVIEIKSKGKEMGVPEVDRRGNPVLDEFGEQVYARRGWGIDEFRKIVASPEEKVKREALTVMLAFVQHGDNKSENQRVSCVKGGSDSPCKEAWLIPQDVGATFGNGVDVSAAIIQGQSPNVSKFDYSRWKDLEVWDSKRRCELKVRNIPFVRALPTTRGFNTFDNKEASEAGRALAARLISGLTDKQIRDIFTIAQVDLRNETFRKAGGLGSLVTVTVDHWVEAFEAKRAELVEHRCKS